MKRIRSGVLVIVLLAGASPWGVAQKPAGKEAAPEAAPEPATLLFEVANRIPPVDRENLKSYWSAVESRTQDKWVKELPAEARPPASMPGEVKITCWVHTDGRVTNVAIEESSGNAALDHAARAAIVGSSPYNPFPYGIAVDRVKVRFTFVYNGGAAPKGSVGM